LRPADPDTVPIVGGVPVAAGEFEEVVRIRLDHGACTGVLVSDRIALTAAHCVDDLKFGQHVSVYTGSEAGEGPPKQASDWAPHPNFCTDCDEPFDLAYVELTLPDDRGIEFARPVVTQEVWDEVVHGGQLITIVGYGEDADGESGTKRSMTKHLDEVSSSGLELRFDARSPRPNHGDSGGPLFAELDSGERVLLGIHSRRLDPRIGDDYYAANTIYPGLCWLRDETGVDLLPQEDPDCDALDITSGLCAVAAEHRGGPLAWSVVALALLGMSRRRRT
jgi:MYXO-CTERM domain-containing protein